jgi:hypothetical protein
MYSVHCTNGYYIVHSRSAPFLCRSGSGWASNRNTDRHDAAHNPVCKNGLLCVHTISNTVVDRPTRSAHKKNPCEVSDGLADLPRPSSSISRNRTFATRLASPATHITAVTSSSRIYSNCKSANSLPSSAYLVILSQSCTRKSHPLGD